MINWKSIVLIINLVFVQITDQSLVENIRSIINEVSNLSGSTGDVLEDLNKITKSSKSFLELCRPAGALIAAALNAGFDPLSDEQLALIELNVNMTKGFDKLNKRIEQMEKTLISDAVETEYRQTVTTKMNLLNQVFTFVTNPNISRTGFKPLFVARCTITAEPLSILESIDQLFRLECPLPEKSEVQQFAKVKDSFRKVYNRIQETNPTKSQRKESEELEADILRKVDCMNSTAVELVIGWLDTFYFGNYADSNTKLRERSNDMPSLNKRCFLREVLISNDHVRDHLVASVKQLIFDLIKVEAFAVLCANATTDGSAAAIDLIINTVNNKTEEIGSHVFKWVKEAQKLSWPEVQVEAAKRDLGYATISVDQYEKSAKVIQNSFESRGPESMSYNVIVSQKLSLQDYWAVKDLSTSVSTIDFNGINFYVFKYTLGQHERSVNASNWLSSKNESIYQVIENARHSESAAGVLTLLNNKVNKLVSDSLFHSALLIRNRDFWYTDAEVLTGSANWTILGANTTFQVYYRFDDFYASGWKLIFNI